MVYLTPFQRKVLEHYRRHREKPATLLRTLKPVLPPRSAIWSPAIARADDELHSIRPPSFVLGFLFWFLGLTGGGVVGPTRTPPTYNLTHFGGSMPKQ